MGRECRPGTAQGLRSQGGGDGKGLAGDKGEMREGRSETQQKERVQL